MPTVQFRTDEATKVKAAAIFGHLGITMSDAINMFLRQAILHGGLPFEVKIPPAPESVTVRSKEELREKLEIGLRQIEEGKVHDARTVMTKYRQYIKQELAKAKTKAKDQNSKWLSEEEFWADLEDSP